MLNEHYKNIALLTFASVFSIQLYSQTDISKHFTVNDGLPSSEVYDIMQDVNGYLWFATDRGICRYNGYYFEKFEIQDGLTDNTILRFFLQEDGTIWCSTFNKKLFYFHPKDYIFKPYRYNSFVSEIPDVAVVNSLFMDNSKTLYVGFINQLGYLSIDSSGKIINHTKKRLPNYRPLNKIVQVRSNGKVHFSFLCENKSEAKGELTAFQNTSIISANYHFYRTATNKDVVAFIDNKELFIVRGNDTTIVNNGFSPIGLGVYDDDHFWVGYNHGGVKTYSLKGELSDSLLTGLSVSKVYRDHENGIWVSTLSSGVYYFQNNSIHTFYFKDGSKSGINSLTSDNKGILFVGCYNGNILEVKNNQSSLIHQSILKKPALVQYNKFTNHLYTFSDQTLSFKGSSGLTILLKNRSLLSFSEEQDSDLIIGGYGGFFITNQLKIKNKFLGLRVYGIAKMEDVYYIASLKGLYKYQDTVLRNLSEDNKLLSFRCNDVDAINNTLYISSLGAGLIISNADTLFNIGVEHGLYSNIVNEITIENDSTIWVCTSSGLNRIRLTKDYKYSISGVSYVDGLVNNEVTDVEIIDSIVWVGTREGLSSFPSSILDKRNNQIKRYLSVSEIKVNDKTVTINDLGNLKHTENRIEISYQAISFKSQGKLSYRFKLHGLENKWNYTNNLQITYPSLPPGAYTFMLQVKGQGDNWDDNKLFIPITIFPPFYKTWWFILAVILSIAALIYSFFKIRILTYNRDIIRELLRQVLKRLKKKTTYFIIKEQGQEIKINTSTILYVKSSGNYLEIFTEKSKHLVRLKIGDFLDIIPDPIEFLRIRRSYIVRIDKIDQKSKKEVFIRGEKIVVGETYLHQLDEIQF